MGQLSNMNTRTQNNPGWTRYRYSTQPGLLPLTDDSLGYDSRTTEGDAYRAGFDPDDEELTLCELAEDWNGHPKGARVLTGLQVEGHPFAVEERPDGVR